MIDVVIPYKQDKLNGVELKYTLRGIEKYLKGYRDIYVIGDKPNLNINHIPFKDVSEIDGHRIKGLNLVNKIMQVCKMDVSREIAIFFDDHFLLKPLEAGEIKYWYEGTIADKLKENITSGFRFALQNTARLLGTDKTPNSIHCPILINKDEFIFKFRNIKEEICFKPFYMADKKCEYMADIKMADFRLNDKEIIKGILKDRLFFSTGSNGIQSAMMEIFEELYPQKSSYEVENKICIS